MSRLSVVRAVVLLAAVCAAHGQARARMQPQRMLGEALARFVPAEPTPQELQGLARLDKQLFQQQTQKIREARAEKAQTETDECAATPLVIIPSLIGNQLFAKLTDKPRAHLWCEKNSDWFRMWIPATTEFYPFVNECWLSFAALEHSPGRYSEPEGVSVRVPDFGSVESLLSLNGNATQSGIWYWIVEALEKYGGYKAGRDLMGAPVDWRWGADGYAPLFEQLTALVENTTQRCGGKKVALTTLSWGGPFTSMFLNSRTQAWKDKYISKFIPLSGAFGGSSWATSTLASHLEYNLYGLFSTKETRALTANWGSIAWLMPNPHVFKNRTFVSTPQKKYSALDFSALLEATNPAAAKTYAATKNFNSHLDAPGVETHCIYGSDLPTLDTFTFTSDAFNHGTNTSSPGDGTVMAEALEVCSGWANQQKETVTTDVFQYMNHGAAVRDPRAIQALLKYLGVHKTLA